MCWKDVASGALVMGPGTSFVAAIYYLPVHLWILYIDVLLAMEYGLCPRVPPGADTGVPKGGVLDCKCACASKKIFDHAPK